MNWPLVTTTVLEWTLKKLNLLHSWIKLIWRLFEQPRFAIENSIHLHVSDSQLFDIPWEGIALARWFGLMVGKTPAWTDGLGWMSSYLVRTKHHNSMIFPPKTMRAMFNSGTQYIWSLYMRAVFALGFFCFEFFMSRTVDLNIFFCFYSNCKFCFFACLLVSLLPITLCNALFWCILFGAYVCVIFGKSIILHHGFSGRWKFSNWKVWQFCS